MKELFRTAFKQIIQIYTPDHAAILIIGFGLLIRIPPILYTSDDWRPSDIASIAHFFGLVVSIFFIPRFTGGCGNHYNEVKCNNMLLKSLQQGVSQQ
jgi:hypothetical protein